MKREKKLAHISCDFYFWHSLYVSLWSENPVLRLDKKYFYSVETHMNGSSHLKHENDRNVIRLREIVNSIQLFFI